MTAREKAESCGEFVRDSLDESGVLVGCECPQCVATCSAIVEGARQAGHWGRVALAETEDWTQLERNAAILGRC